MSYPSPTEDLFVIRSDDFSDAEINRIAQVFPVSGKNMEQKRIRVVNKLSILALDAARSAVPIRTEELRNSQVIRQDFATKKRPESRIIVSSDTHGSGPSEIPADVLSAILDRGWHQKEGQKRSRQYERSENSHISNLSGVNLYQYVEKGKPTKGWIRGQTNSAVKFYNDARRSLSTIG